MSNLDWKKILMGLAVLIVIGGIAVAATSLLLGGSPSSQTTGGTFGSAQTSPQGGTGASSLPVFSSSTTSAQTPPAVPVFEVSQGPVVGAVLVQMGYPTTTIARYVTGTDGHILDQRIDVPGAAAQIVSNTTIPGVERAIWSRDGRGVILQYLEAGALKSVYLELTAAASSTAATPLAIHFLPDNLIDVAFSPDGSSVAYLLQTASGAQGYVSKPDGSASKSLFSVPLSQLTLSWPAPSTLLLSSKSASGVPGIAFSVNAKTGAVSPLLYGVGLTATGNPSFSYALYRTDDGSAASFYAQKMRGAAALIALPAPLDAPFPEQCAWSAASSTLAYCAAPVFYVPAGYLDLWHRGQSSIADTLIAIDAGQGSTTPLVTPGTRDGGEPSDMIDLSLSQDGHYLSFIAKDDQTLWGIRL